MKNKFDEDKPYEGYSNFFEPISHHGSQGSNPLVDELSRVDVKQAPKYGEFNTFMQYGARMADNAIKLAMRFGYVQALPDQKVLDFGSGSGGPTYALVNMGKAVNWEVEAVDSSENAAGEIISNGILPEGAAHTADGIELLRNSGEKYDMVTSFMFGPDGDGALFTRLAEASKSGLKENGSLVVTSDFGTISTVREILSQRGISHNVVHGVPEADVPTTVIVSRAALTGTQDNRIGVTGHGVSELSLSLRGNENIKSSLSGINDLPEKIDYSKFKLPQLENSELYTKIDLSKMFSSFNLGQS